MTKSDLYEIAGQLNNHAAHILIDKVTIMAFMDLEECVAHVEYMKKQIADYEAKPKRKKRKSGL